jgi:hypothetical protein
MFSILITPIVLILSSFSIAEEDKNAAIEKELKIKTIGVIKIENIEIKRKL